MNMILKGKLPFPSMADRKTYYIYEGIPTLDFKYSIDENGQPVGWRLKVRELMADGSGYKYNDYLVGQMSDNSEIVFDNGWFDSELLFGADHLGSAVSTLPHGWIDGSYGSGSGSSGNVSGGGSALTGAEVSASLAGDRALGDANAEAERVTQTTGVDGANPDFQGYVENDIPSYTDEETSVSDKVNTLMTNSDLSNIKNSLGVSTLDSSSSFSCNLYGTNIIFDFAKHESIYNIIGAFILSLSYIFGFFLVLRG